MPLPLQRYNIIDYSLLVGIHFRDPANPIAFPGEDDPTAVGHGQHI